jgi:hypothetical protein
MEEPVKNIIGQLDFLRFKNYVGSRLGFSVNDVCVFLKA